MFSAKLFVVILFFSYHIHAWTLEQTYNSANFFSQFSFFTDADPTEGDVSYVDKATATSAGLISTSGNQVYLGVDYTTVNPPNGRQSVRLTSNQAFNEGLFIADIQHMPGPACGIWPAYWLFGPNWPASGEIDIIEGVNLQSTNQITLHTAPGCTINGSGSVSSTTIVTSNCNQDNAGTGCSYATASTNNYGAGFNSGGGGVYAMQWEESGIFVWFWPRSSIPSDITSGNPNPTGWGTPLAAFQGSGCDFTTAFANLNIVFDTTFCGSWAGAVWSSGSCASYASTCKAYVDATPSAFTAGYWLINYIKIYQ